MDRIMWALLTKDQLRTQLLTQAGGLSDVAERLYTDDISGEMIYRFSKTDVENYFVEN